VATYGLGSLGLAVVGAVAWVVWLSGKMNADSLGREEVTLASTLGKASQLSATPPAPRRHIPNASGVSVAVPKSPAELVPGAPPSWGFAWIRMPDEAALVLLGAAENARMSHEGHSLEPFATPTAAEDLACAIKAVRAYAQATSPETAAGPLEVEILATRAVPNDSAAEARVVLCTPPTQGSGRSQAVVRADQIWHLDKQAPIACEACGAPIVTDSRTCQYCGADIGEGEWRIVQAEPVLRSASPLSRGWPALDNFIKQVGPLPNFTLPEEPGGQTAGVPAGAE